MKYIVSIRQSYNKIGWFLIRFPNKSESQK